MAEKEMPKAYEPGSYEDNIYEKWEKSGFFNPDNLDLPENAPAYSIVMPPPNVTGTLHMGHASMLAIEDILIRFHRMRGERALWIPGTDHAAIATQTKVEKIIKKEGESRHTLGREKFLARVREFAQESHDTIKNQVKKMGSSCDWSREAYTLDATREKAVNSVFKLMYDDGLIYRGERIVNWCPRCHSTLSDDEVEYKAQKAKLYTFKYDKNFPIAISTTRPETKLGDTAVAVNPKDGRYKDLVGKSFDADFAGVPLKLKIIADRNIEMEFGTGALGVTPAHSHIDWQMAEENDLEKIKVIDEDGKIYQQFGVYGGKTALEAREMIVEKLRDAGLMEKEEEIENNLSLCYRCDTPIEPLPSLQWFIDVNKPLRGRKRAAENSKQKTDDRGQTAENSKLKTDYREQIDWEGKSIKEVCLEVVKSGKIRIVPERFEKSYYHWMENLRDWCISRQIWFGHQVPVWYKENAKCKSQNAKLRNKEIGNWKLDIGNSSTEVYVGLDAPEGEGWKKDEDTLDTWFSSGLWTFSTLASSPEEIKIEDGRLVIDSEDFRKFHPTAVLETGYDILFFWVARMIIMTAYAVGEIPFKDVYLHGLVLDEKGKKMSKSKGNVIDPLDMIPKYGTDAVRMSLVIGSSPGNDIRISEEKIAGFRNLVNKVWNVARYISQKTENRKQQTDDISPTLCDNADMWILRETLNLILETTNSLEQYNFSRAGELLREFTWNSLADWYIETTKFVDNKEVKENKNNILFTILRDMLKLWHPFTPFVTEAIRQEIGEEKLLMINEWPDGKFYENIIHNDSLTAYEDRWRYSWHAFEIVKDVITAIRNARSLNKVEPAKKIKAVLRSDKYAEALMNNGALIKGMRTGIDELAIENGRGEDLPDSIYSVVSGVDIYLLGAIDHEKEKARMEKEIANLRKLVSNTENKLANQEFVSKAPAPIVEKEKSNLEKWKSDLAQLEEKIKKL